VSPSRRRSYEREAARGGRRLEVRATERIVLAAAGALAAIAVMLGVMFAFVQAPLLAGGAFVLILVFLQMRRRRKER